MSETEISFRITFDERTVEFKVKTTLAATSYHGTSFIPNNCRAKLYKGQVRSITLERLDDNGWNADDIGGPDGAVLAADFGGGQLIGKARTGLPRLVQDALAAIEAL